VSYPKAKPSGGQNSYRVLITFEGIEGSGKSTLIATLASDLRNRQIDIHVTREPGGTPLGDRIRSIFLYDADLTIDPLAEALLINASRAQLVADVISPALRAGTMVLCDRFFDATLAYQGFGRGLDVEMLLELSLSATRRIAPDLTFLLDLPVERSRERLRERGTSDRLERETLEFHNRVRHGYLELAQRFKRIVVLDATLAPEALAVEASRAIESRRVGI